MFDRQPGDNSAANKRLLRPARSEPLLSCPCSPVGSASSGGKIQEMNDRTRATDERRRENGNDRQKERALGQKISSRFVTKILATDIEERRPGVADWTAVGTIERECLVNVVGDGETPSRAKNSPNI